MAEAICCRSLVSWRSRATSDEFVFTSSRISPINCSARAFSFTGTRSPSSSICRST